MYTNPSQSNQNDIAQLKQAIETNNVAQVTELLEKNPNLLTASLGPTRLNFSTFGLINVATTPLAFAIFKKNKNMVEAIFAVIEKNPNIDKNQIFNFSLFFNEDSYLANQKTGEKIRQLPCNIFEFAAIINATEICNWLLENNGARLGNLLNPLANNQPRLFYYFSHGIYFGSRNSASKEAILAWHQQLENNLIEKIKNGDLAGVKTLVGDSNDEEKTGCKNLLIFLKALPLAAQYGQIEIVDYIHQQLQKLQLPPASEFAESPYDQTIFGLNAVELLTLQHIELKQQQALLEQQVNSLGNTRLTQERLETQLTALKDKIAKFEQSINQLTTSLNPQQNPTKGPIQLATTLQKVSFSNLLKLAEMYPFLWTEALAAPEQSTQKKTSINLFINKINTAEQAIVLLKKKPEWTLDLLTDKKSFNLLKKHFNAAQNPQSLMDALVGAILDSKSQDKGKQLSALFGLFSQVKAIDLLALIASDPAHLASAALDNEDSFKNLQKAIRKNPGRLNTLLAQIASEPDLLEYNHDKLQQLIVVSQKSSLLKRLRYDLRGVSDEALVNRFFKKNANNENLSFFFAETYKWGLFGQKQNHDTALSYYKQISKQSPLAYLRAQDEIAHILFAQASSVQPDNSSGKVQEELATAGKHKKHLAWQDSKLSECLHMANFALTEANQEKKAPNLSAHTQAQIQEIIDSLQNLIDNIGATEDEREQSIVSTEDQQKLNQIGDKPVFIKAVQGLITPTASANLTHSATGQGGTFEHRDFLGNELPTAATGEIKTKAHTQTGEDENPEDSEGSGGSHLKPSEH